MGARARISQYGRRRDPLAAARMMYGAAPHAQYMQQMPEMDRYGSWYNPLSWWSPKKPELMYDDEGAYYEDPYEQELATNPHRYDLEGFNVTVSPAAACISATTACATLNSCGELHDLPSKGGITRTPC